MVQDINFKRKHSGGNFNSALKDLFKQNKFTDVTLVSDDMVAFKAHKFVLGACSPVLREILINNFHPHPTIYLKGVLSNELDSILHFLYLGRTQFDHSRIDKLFEAQKEFQIKQLGEILTMKNTVINQNDEFEIKDSHIKRETNDKFPRSILIFSS